MYSPKVRGRSDSSMPTSSESASGFSDLVVRLIVVGGYDGHFQEGAPMIARSLVVAVVLAVTAVSSGCIVPRTAGYGFTAMPLAPGAADVGVALGLIYQQESSTTSPGGATNTSTSRQTQIPAFEANAQLGITDQLAVNLHAS